MGIIRRIIILLAVFSVLVIGGLALFIPNFDEADHPQNADYIVVLSADYNKNGTLRPQTKARVDRAIALFNAGLAPRIIMSGGTHEYLYPTAAVQMRIYAVAQGVPTGSVIAETQSHSTLQNALFVSALIKAPDTARIALVTHRYHLPRAWASFRWAGLSNIDLFAADPQSPFQPVELLYEVAKIPLNILRALAASLAAMLGVPLAGYAPLLG